MLPTNLTFISVFHGKLQSSLHCSFIGMELDLPRYAQTKWIAFLSDLFFFFCARDRMVGYLDKKLLRGYFCWRKQ